MQTTASKLENMRVPHNCSGKTPSFRAVVLKCAHMISEVSVFCFELCFFFLEKVTGFMSKTSDALGQMFTPCDIRTRQGHQRVHVLFEVLLVNFPFRS